MTTARSQGPTIRKVITKGGEIRYRFVIDMGKRPDGGRDQRMVTCLTLKDAKDKRDKISVDRSGGTLVKPQRSPSMSCASAGWIPVTMSGRSPGSDMPRC